MNTKKLISVFLAAGMCLGVLSGCNNNPGGDDKNPGGGGGVYVPTQEEETVPVVFGIDGADGVFSPFFSTASYDSEITGLTQLGMLTSKENNYVYGDDEACITKDLDISYLDANQSEISSSDGAVYTRYDFLIKKGIKFSDGVELTIDDVLFNLYVYLDPSYTGSSTMYSTDIVGLSAYRTQNADADDNASDAIENQATRRANDRLMNIYYWLVNRYLLESHGGVPPTGTTDEGDSYHPEVEENSEEIIGDINFFLPYFRQEIDTNYESAVASFDETRKSYTLEEGEYWQAFLYTYGLLYVEEEGASGKKVKKFVVIDKNGDYQTVPEDAGFDESDLVTIGEDGTFEKVTDPNAKEDPENGIYTVHEVYVINFEGSSVTNANVAAKEEIEEYAEAHWQEMSGKDETEKRNNAKRECAVQMVYRENVGTADLSKESITYDDIDFKAFNTYKNFASTVLGSGSTNTLFTELLADERSQIIEETAGDNHIRSISGVTTSKVTSFTNVDGETYELGEEYDVLHILVNKVDPKAIWNFAFTVAPKHYYAPDNLLESFKKDGKDINFGVVYNSTDFMNNVLRRSQVIGVPVGAGPYMASTESGKWDGDYPVPNQFLRNNRVYYERNPYFDSVDGVVGGTIQNAKIKYLQYTVINTNFLLDSLIEGEIDVGAPNATRQNTNRLNNYQDTLSSTRVMTNGYGYVGINAGKIPDVWLRRAIIMAMDTTIISNGYYNGGLCELIYRPMSLTSWAYPKGATAFRTEDGSIDYTFYHSENSSQTLDNQAAAQKIADMLSKHGYSVNGGQVLGGPGSTGALQKLTFTVAGESNDHPAWQMFKNAEEILESIGFEVDVKTDAFALTKLSNGELAVWAAAWSSTIDPDMYQVYHKDSMASSTYNWGYREIKSGAVSSQFAQYVQPGYDYDYEKGLIDDLSDLIDDARAVIDQNTRADIYSAALDLVMELAVEMPTYQRNDLTVYKSAKIDKDTLNPNPTANDDLFSKIWEVGYNR